MKSRTAAFASALTLAACNSQTAPTTPTQVTTDLQGLVTELGIIEPAIIQAAPNALSAAQQQELNNDLAAAKAALAQFQTGLPAPTGASKAQVIDQYINDTMATLAVVSTSVPALQSFSVPIDAIDAVLPAVETFVNSFLPANMTTPAAGPLVQHPVSVHTPAWGRAELHIPEVSK